MTTKSKIYPESEHAIHVVWGFAQFACETLIFLITGIIIGVKMLGNEAKNTLKDFLFKISKPQLSKIHKFKDTHKDEDGYFFGNGVSMKWFDLKQFSNKASIGCTFIPFHKSFHDLNIKYTILHEPFWFYPAFWTKYVVSNTSQPRTMKAFRKIILDNPDKHFFADISNFPLLRSKNVNFLFHFQFRFLSVLKMMILENEIF